MERKRFQEIADQLLRQMVLGAEAVDPVKGLVAKVRKMCQAESAVTLAEEVTVILSKELHKLVASGAITAGEGLEFGGSLGRLIFESAFKDRAVHL
ncbi:MAG: hypothetical protein WCT25_04405 [Candidatus Paceibacterota bacterium]